jgi:hypothetical protein
VTLLARLLAAVIVLAVPVALIQNRGLVPLAALGAAAALACLRHRLGALAAQAASGAMLAALALAVWATLSTFWAVVPSDALAGGLRLAALVAMLGVLAAAASLLDEGGAEALGRAMLLASLLCAALLAVELLAGAPLNNALRGFPDPPRMPDTTKPAATLLALCAGPAVLAAWQRAGLRAAIPAALAIGAAVAASTSESARLALTAGIAAGATALAAPVVARRALPAALALAVLAGPPLLEQVAKAALRADALPLSAVHRTMIWDYASERAAERPLAGFGMDAARSIPGGGEPVEAARLDRFGVTGAKRAFFDEAPPAFIQRIPLHTHSMPLQVRLELGFVGLGLFALFAFLAGRAAAALPGRGPFAAGAAITASAAVVSLLSYGAWQHWWWIAVALAALPLAALSGRAGR